MIIRPGEVVWADTVFGRRPAIVISREQLNRGDTIVIVVVLCTTAKLALRSMMPNCVPFAAGEYGFTKECVAQSETVQMIEKQYIDPHPIGVLTDEKLREVIRAVGYVMDADCEPT